MVNFTQFTKEDLETIIDIKFNEDIHIHSDYLEELQIKNLEGKNFTLPIGINPIVSREDAFVFFEENNTTMSKLANLTHRLYIAGADLFLDKVREKHFRILVQFSPFSNLKYIEKGVALYEKIDAIDTLAKLNELNSYFHKHSISDGTESHLVNRRILQKYIELYLTTPDTRPQWKGKLINGRIEPIEVDIQNTVMLITFKGVQYTATIDKGLKFSDTGIPSTTLDLFDKYIVEEVGNACKNLFLYNSYAPVTAIV